MILCGNPYQALLVIPVCSLWNPKCTGNYAGQNESQSLQESDIALHLLSRCVATPFPKPVMTVYLSSPAEHGRGVWPEFLGGKPRFFKKGIDLGIARVTGFRGKSIKI